MKKRIVAFFIFSNCTIHWNRISQTVQASDVNNPFELPSTFSDNVTLYEIESALNTYITENNLNIEVGTPEYIEFLANLSLPMNIPNIDETQLRYFRS